VEINQVSSEPSKSLERRMAGRNDDPRFSGMHSAPVCLFSLDDRF
jgi:hypothetical protein